MNRRCFLCERRLSRIGVRVADNRGRVRGFIVGICLWCNWGKGWNDFSFYKKIEARLARFFLGDVEETRKIAKLLEPR